MPSLYLNIAFATYFLSMVFYFTELFFTTGRLRTKNRVLSFFARLLIICGIVSLTVYMVMRWHIAQRPPLSNMFESMIVFAWAIALAGVFIDLRYKIKNVSALVSLMGLLTLGGASLLDQDIIPLLPALKSNWLTIHVLTCFIGYAALTVAFVSSAILLVQKVNNEKLDPSLRPLLQRYQEGLSLRIKGTGKVYPLGLDVISYKMIAFGFLFLTLGIITGAVWANSAWGTYWSWDPKETWSLITWFVYAIYLHVRIRRGWRGKRAAWLSVVGFLAMLFTYFGVNYLLSGLHSYA